MTTFIAWLAQYEDEPTSIGNLARDVRQDRRDGCFTGKTAEGLRRHIRSRHGVVDSSYVNAVDAAEERYSAATSKGGSDMLVDFIHGSGRCGPGHRGLELAARFADEEIDPWDLRGVDRDDPVDDPQS